MGVILAASKGIPRREIAGFRLGTMIRLLLRISRIILVLPRTLIIFCHCTACSRRHFMSEMSDHYQTTTIKQSMNSYISH